MTKFVTSAAAALMVFAPTLALAAPPKVLDNPPNTCTVSVFGEMRKLPITSLECMQQTGGEAGAGGAAAGGAAGGGIGTAAVVGGLAAVAGIVGGVIAVTSRPNSP